MPCPALGPYAKPGHISSQENSHVSLVRFCEDVFGLEPLTERDAASNEMSGCFDFDQAPQHAPASVS